MEEQRRENRLGEIERQRMLRVDIEYKREGEAARGNAREELGGGGIPGASYVDDVVQPSLRSGA